MPTLIVQTNVKVPAERRKVVLEAASSTVAEQLGKPESYVMVLVERVVEKHAIDFEKIKKNYHLSNRELDIIKSLCQGLSNRAIGEKLFISEYTVKDHLKNIMAKMGAESRNEILALLR